MPTAISISAAMPDRIHANTKRCTTTKDAKVVRTLWAQTKDQKDNEFEFRIWDRFFLKSWSPIYSKKWTKLEKGMKPRKNHGRHRRVQSTWAVKLPQTKTHNKQRESRSIVFVDPQRWTTHAPPSESLDRAAPDVGLLRFELGSKEGRRGLEGSSF